MTPQARKHLAAVARRLGRDLERGRLSLADAAGQFESLAELLRRADARPAGGFRLIGYDDDGCWHELPGVEDDSDVGRAGDFS